MSEYTNYHKIRGNDIYNMSYRIPKYMKSIIGTNKDIRILDIGCGNGSVLYGLKLEGYNNIFGIDLDEEVLSVAKEYGIPCKKQDALTFFPHEKYDVIYMCHLLEHLPKNQVISFLSHVKNNLLSDGGVLLIRVPNAQSNTNCYWAYEDFTHNTLFTAGSLDFVLKSAGFQYVDFLDVYGLKESTLLGKIIKMPLLLLYKFNKWFWNQVTRSVYHPYSKNIYTWELKAVAYMSKQKK